MKNAAALAFVFLLSCMCSCSNKTIVCYENGIFLSGIGFTTADLGGGSILYRYKKDNAFDSLFDSVKCDPKTPLSDTLLLTQSVSPDYDYKLMLTATNAVYNITTITIGDNKTETIHEGLFNQKAYHCTRRLVSYSVNSTAYTAGLNDNAMTGDTIFVRK